MPPRLGLVSDMTRIYAERDSVEGKFYLSSQGHATGSDKACAAVSGLLYALGGYLLNASGIQVRVDTLDSGDAVFDFTGDRDAVGAFTCVVIGLMQVAKEYPEQVQMEYIEK